VHLSLGGSRLRVRLSNEFGNGALAVKAAHVATCKANPVDSSIDAATDKALAFSSAAGVSVPAGQAVWSDPVDFPVTALGNLAITIAFGAVPTNVTGHPGSRTTSYEQANSTNVSASSMAGAQKVDHWYAISGVDVVAEPGAQALVILGDSITDGRGTTTNGNDRWPDDLAKRLQANATTRKIAVLNQGIGGNTLADPSSLGPRALDRYSRDVLGQSGVRWVIVFEGVNDIGAGASAASVTAAYDQLIAMAHAQKLAIYGATITPFNGHSYYSAEHESARQAVNTYIRSGKFDAVIDFDAAVRDPANTSKLQAAYDVDGLHMNPAGYQKLADTVDLKLFTP
jgi:lysophospholipase L1-like esterase